MVKFFQNEESVWCTTEIDIAVLEEDLKVIFESE